MKPHLRFHHLLWVILLLAACSAPAERTPRSLPTLVIPPTSTATSAAVTLEPALTSIPSQPAPAASPTPSTQPYPPPGATQAPPALPSPTSPVSISPTAGTPFEPVSSVTPATTVAPGTTVPPGTAVPPASVVTTAFPSVITENTNRPVTPRPPATSSTVTIWHAFNNHQTQLLELVIQSFQRAYPNVQFDILYIPQDELFDLYQKEAYRGGGPSLLLGPAEWGPGLFDGGLVADLTPFVSQPFLEAINPGGRGTASYRGRYISLPYALQGVLLFRNKEVVYQAPHTFDELLQSARLATQPGRIGADLEISAFFSAAHLIGLGGQIMDADGLPAFNDQRGLAWLELLMNFKQAGLTEQSSNQDIQLFEAGQVGFIIDGSWNISALADAIDPEDLAIDPWPSAAGGRLSGFVQGESVFLNSRLAGDDQRAALQFMGYLLAPEVQSLLADSGLVPSVLAATPRDPLTQQAMTAFATGTAYPNLPNLSLYWNALDSAIYSVFEQQVNPADALQQATDDILTRLQTTK